MELGEHKLSEEKMKNENTEREMTEKSAGEETAGKSLADTLFPEESESMPEEVKKEYENLILKVKEASPGISEKEAADKVFEAEKKYDYSFFWVQYKKEGTRELVLDKRKLLATKELNLLSNEEKKQLDLIKSDFNKIISEVSGLTGESRQSCEYYLDKILDSGFAKDMKEAKEVLINGPKIEGFEETQDVKISNKKVSEFLENAFGKDILRKCMIALIYKDDRFIIKCDNIEKTNELAKKFNLNFLAGTNLRVADNREDYIKAEMYLEGVDSENELKHLYKVRATAGFESEFAKIDLHSFGVEKSDDFDYLNEHKLLTSEDQKMKAYILGTIVHEVVHRMEQRGKEDMLKFKQYEKIVEKEACADKKFVSDYVRRHKDLYDSSEYQTVREDFAEAVRIYLTNADYLKAKYKQRYKFIKDNYPFIKENSIVDILK